MTQPTLESSSSRRARRASSATSAAEGSAAACGRSPPPGALARWVMALSKASAFRQDNGINLRRHHRGGPRRVLYGVPGHPGHLWWGIERPQVAELLVGE